MSLDQEEDHNVNVSDLDYVSGDRLDELLFKIASSDKKNNIVELRRFEIVDTSNFYSSKSTLEYFYSKYF